MHCIKFSGVIEEIAQRYPNIDIAEFLQDKLQLPPFKAEELASRIEKQYFKDDQSEAEKKAPILLLERSGDTASAAAYSVDCLSDMEFEGFIRWLLEQLGYEIQSTLPAAGLGVEFVASKDAKTVVVAVKCPKTCEVSDLIVSIAKEAQDANGCDKAVVIATAHFSPQATEAARKAGVELLDIDVICERIVEVTQKPDTELQSRFPEFRGSLLQCLIALPQTKEFLIESKAGEKFDLYLPGVKHPLLTFQAQSGAVIQCVFRIKYNEPVSETEGEALISSDKNGRFGPDDEEAYILITQYLEQFLE